MNTTDRINDKIRNGKKVNTFGFIQVENNLNISESLEFISYLSDNCIEKGRTQGTTNGMRITSDWYHLVKGDIEIQKISAISIYDRRKDYHKIVWTPNQ